jgi:hypothetical protein
MVLTRPSHGEDSGTTSAINAPTFSVGDFVRLVVTDNVHGNSFTIVSPVLTNGAVRLFNAEDQAIGSVILSNKTQSKVIRPVLMMYARTDFSTNFTINISATNRFDMSDFPVTLIVDPEPLVRQHRLPRGDYWTPEERLQFDNAAFAKKPLKKDLGETRNGSPTSASKTSP